MAIVIAAMVGALAPSSASKTADLQGGEVPFRKWAQLQYTTSKLLIFSGDLTMTRKDSGETTTVKAESRARLFGSEFLESWSLSTMSSGLGRPLEFLDVRPGKKAERWYFKESGIVRETLKPHKQNPKELLESWRVTKTEKLPDTAHAPDPPGPARGSPKSAPPAPEERPAEGRVSADGATDTGDAWPANKTAEASASRSAGAAASDPSQWVHDYIAMIVRLKDLPLAKPGDEATVRVSTNKGPAPMRIRVGEERKSRRTLTDLATGRRRTFELREFRLRVTPMSGSASDTKGFMDMEGETELWVEAATRTLVEISGNVQKVPGRVVITLAGYR